MTTNAIGTAGVATRRDFLKTLGGGIVVVIVGRGGVAAALEPFDEAALAGEELLQQGADSVGAWIRIDETGAVSVFTGKVEVGQGIRTSLAQAVAEELRVPLDSIRMVMADTDLTPFDQGTFGSRSTPQMGPQLRRAGATARELLIGLAAERWRVDRSTLSAANGRVTGAGGRSAGYGELTSGQRLTATIRADTPLTPASEWKVMGTSPHIVGAREIVTGTHRFTSDIDRPGMLHGKVLRPRAWRSTLTSADVARARSMPGVIVAQEDDFVAVAAPSVVEAERAAAAISVMWTPPSGPHPSSAGIYDYLRTTPASGGGGGGGGRGGRGGATGATGAAGAATRALETPAGSASVSGGVATVNRRYTTAYIAHVPLEPRAAVAEWTTDADGEKLTVWTGTQRPWGVRDELAAHFRMQPTRVRVIVPDTGSGYGGKHSGEAAVEAARIAKAAGKPVRLVWSREEEFRWAYFRPAAVIDIAARAGSDGRITEWTLDNYNSGGAALRSTYAIPGENATYHASASPFKQGSYRGLASVANNFARETHIDELAELLKIDPLEFRRRNIQDARLRAVLDAAADRAGWGAALPPGSGAGIACGFDKGGYVATCATVAVDRVTGAVALTRIVAAFECGAIVNPAGVENQVIGSLVQGIGGALFEAIDFENGIIRNSRLSQYRVPRFSDTPPIEVVLVDRKDLPSAGAGEAPIIALAPAIGGAIWAATGKRPRAMPMARDGMREGTGG